MDTVSRQRQVNVLVAPGVDARVSADLIGATVQEAIDAMLRPSGLIAVRLDYVRGPPTFVIVRSGAAVPDARSAVWSDDDGRADYDFQNVPVGMILESCSHRRRFRIRTDAVMASTPYTFRALHMTGLEAVYAVSAVLLLQVQRAVGTDGVPVYSVGQR
jgi:hypothetical protein